MLYSLTKGATDIWPKQDMCRDCFGGGTRKWPYCNCVHGYKEQRNETCKTPKKPENAMKSLVFIAGIIFIVNFGFMIAAKFLKL